MIIAFGMVCFGRSVTAAMEIGAMVVPWQAQPITAIAATNPPNPFRKNPPSYVGEKKFPASTLATPNTMNSARAATSRRVTRFSRTVIKREPL